MGLKKGQDSSSNQYSILPIVDGIESGQQYAQENATNTVDYNSHLNILSRSNQCRLSGVVCTIGPVSREPEYLCKMINAGMNIARMNFSHGTHEYHGKTIANCREAVKLYTVEKGFNPSLSIALDTKGPEIRTGLLEGDDGRKELTLEAGAKVKLTTDPKYKEKCTNDVIYLDYLNITKVMEVGKRIFIDDGLISIVAEKIGDDHVIGVVENGGNLGSRKGCNLPATDTDLPAVSEKDKMDLKFGVEHDVDMVFASFIRNADGVKQIRQVMGEKGKDILIISKIENQQGVNNIDEIIEASDGIMVARGDMGIEIPPEKVFIAQKQIISKCNKAGKPVICATQMLESMVKKPRPTRAEGSDVANAVLDGADCVMLSGETAKGDYPIQCIQTMAALAREAESCLWNQKFFEDIMHSVGRSGVLDSTDTTSISAVHSSYLVRASAIIAITTTGRTSRAAAKFRPRCPIISVSRDAAVSRRLQLHRGVLPLVYEPERDADWTKDVDNRIQYAVEYGKKFGFIKSGDPIVAITGWRQGAGSSNTVRILYVDQNL